MLKLSNFLFTGADFVDRLLNVQIWPLSRTVVCVRACACVCGGGGQDVITIQTSTMTPLSATVSRVSTARGVGGWGSGYKCILLSQRVLVYACAKYRWK